MTDLSGLRWHKSSRSGGAEGSDCVEAATLPGGIGVALRDSKDPAGPVLRLTPSVWKGLLGSLTGSS
jgi:hypothetical protein